MFSINFSTQVKTTVTVKKTKVTDFGKAGELSMKGVKARMYIMFPPKNQRYMEISNISIEWIPTVPHLLEQSPITVKAKDTRGTSGTLGSNELIFMRKAAHLGWSAAFPCSIMVPAAEISSGLPLSFDIDIPALGLKANREIGKLKLSVGLAAVEGSEKFSMGPVTFNYARGSSKEGETIVWKGMKNEHREDAHDSSATIAVAKYLDGNLSLSELGTILCNRMLTG